MTGWIKVTGLMYSLIETNPAAAIILSFDADCLADLRANGSK